MNNFMGSMLSTSTEEEEPNDFNRDQLLSSLKSAPPPVPPKPCKKVTSSETVDSVTVEIYNTIEGIDGNHSTSKSLSSSVQSGKDLQQSVENIPLPRENSSPKEMCPLGLVSNLAQSEINEIMAESDMAMDEFGDCGQSHVLKPIQALVKGDTPNLANWECANEAINQSFGFLATESDQSQTQTDTGQPLFLASGCPFISFHNQNPNISEFLGNKIIGGDTLDFADFPSNSTCSKKVNDTLQFIVENVQDGGGIWPSVFVEKLIRMLVTTEDEVRRCFCEHDYSILHKLVESFCKEKRCGLVIRYYCLFYNMMSHTIVPLVEMTKTKLVDRVKQDLVFAAQNICRCGNCQPDENDVLNCNLSQLEAKEHLKFSSTLRLVLASILLIPLYSELATLHETGMDHVMEKQLSTTMIRLICDYDSTHVFHQHNHTPSGELTVHNSKFILAHLLISQNLCFGNEMVNNPLLEALAEFRSDHSQLKEKLMTIFIQELNAYRQGYKRGVQSALNVNIQAPLGLQPTGIYGPLKMFSDILSLRNDGVDTDVDFQFLNVDDLCQIRNFCTIIQDNVSSQPSSGSGIDVEIQLNTRKLMTVVLQKIYRVQMKRQIIGVNSDRLEMGVDFKKGSAGINMTLANSRFTMNDAAPASRTATPTAEIPSEEGKRSILSKSKVMLRPLEIMLKWLGCSKRMNSSTVCPASVRDVEYLSETQH